MHRPIIESMLDARFSPAAAAIATAATSVALGGRPRPAPSPATPSATRFDSPLGPVRALASSRGVLSLGFEAGHSGPPQQAHPDARIDAGPFGVEGTPWQSDAGRAILDRLEGELQAYWQGRLTRFTVPLDLQGTPFQREVWSALLEIGHGCTRSYADLAQRIGRPQAARAVGAAVGRNPVAIVVPCHRVIGRDGQLTGFAWGLERKRHLLVHEAPGRGT